MFLDNRSLVLIVVVLAAVAVFGLVPSWIAVVAAVLGLVIVWQREREQGVREHELESNRIREHVPELVGMDFVQRATYMLRSVDEFKANYGQDLANTFVREFKTARESFATRGESPPDWLGLYVLRRVERGFLEFVANEQSKSETAKPAPPPEGKGQ